MKTPNLDIAKRLADITGRPLEDFYEGEIKNENNQNGCEQANKNNNNVPIHIGEHGINKNKASSVEEDIHEGVDFLELKILANKYEGQIVGKYIMHAKKPMKRKEYLSMKFKTEEEFWSSPLLYIMFRSEEQIVANFTNWTDSMLRRING